LEQVQNKHELMLTKWTKLSFVRVLLEANNFMSLRQYNNILMVRYHIYSAMIDTWILICININYLKSHERDLVDKLIIFLFKYSSKMFS
jgi:hypothetical protein